MLQHIQLLRNVGSFDSVAPGANLPFAKLNLIYAENGRGKTTLAALMRSLVNGDARLVQERHRLGAAHPPHIILAMAGGGNHTFQQGGWSAPLPSMAVFDDTFVAENVCSGIEVESGHRQNLHELILGAQGVTLNATLQGHVAAIEEHNRNLRTKEDAIPAAVRGGMTVEAFCALAADARIDERIQEAERTLAAGQAAARIVAEPDFEIFGLPSFDVDAIQELLARDLPLLEAAAVARVQEHLASLGDGGERWVGEGMNIINRPAIGGAGACPFCEQDLAGSPIITHYRAYFSAEYAALKAELHAAARTIAGDHGGDVPAAFERFVRVAGQRRQFWANFADVPPIDIDTAQIAVLWKKAREAVQTAISAKQGAPLDRLTLDDEALDSIAAYRRAQLSVAGAVEALVSVNGSIAVVKEKSQAANVEALTSDLARLRATKARHDLPTAELCEAYLAEKTAKAATERLRAQARQALDNYRQNVFPAYQNTINTYLQRFGAGFRLADVGSVNTRAGSSATYNVVINNQPVALTAEAGPSFRNTLSAGDRNTLALAFFFASLEQDPDLGNKIAVIDDPMTSLDEHRALVTVQQMLLMLDRVRQMIVLSHSKPFLLSLWKDGPKNDHAAIRITRAQVGSGLDVWNVNQDSITEHDRRYERVASYLLAADLDQERTVAMDLRPMLEAFVRVAYPREFIPGSMLGQFVNQCAQRVGAQNQILTAADTTELRALLDFANRYHHDTNPTWQTEIINDQELTHFAERTLAFIRRA
jgi:wobble nucleotide-excising tRNase